MERFPTKKETEREIWLESDEMKTVRKDIKEFNGDLKKVIQKYENRIFELIKIFNESVKEKKATRDDKFFMNQIINSYKEMIEEVKRMQ